jgi:hypothetical protein
MFISSNRLAVRSHRCRGGVRMLLKFSAEYVQEAGNPVLKS